MSEFSITVLIGVTNETESLKKTVFQIFEQCDARDISKVYLVKSKTVPQATNEAISFLEKKFPGKAVGFEQSKPFVGGALQDSFLLVKSSHMMLLPADLAIDLSVLPQLIAKAKQHPHSIVKVSRWLVPNSFHNYSRVRKVLNACAQVFLRQLYQTDLTDFTMSVLIMPSKIYEIINWRELDFSVFLELMLCPTRLGVSIIELPGTCYGRIEGESNNSFMKTAHYLKTAFRIRFEKKENLIKKRYRSKIKNNS